MAVSVIDAGYLDSAILFLVPLYFMVEREYLFKLFAAGRVDFDYRKLTSRILGMFPQCSI